MKKDNTPVLKPIVTASTSTVELDIKGATHCIVATLDAKGNEIGEFECSLRSFDRNFANKPNFIKKKTF